MSILNELSLESGSLKVEGRVSYAPQESWAFMSTVRENILFGSQFDEKKYRKVVEVCALDRDFKLFPYGDKTLVGERGVSLSGGQKARITLARALYREADVYLLDDPLSAVDASVAKHIFQECVMEFLRDKARILVTHQIQFLRNANKIMVLKEGKCIAFGSYDQLLRDGINFMSFVSETKVNENEKLEQNITSRQMTRALSMTPSIVSSIGGSDSGLDEPPKDCPEEDEPKVKAETREMGSIDKSIYMEYFKAGAGPVLMFVALSTMIISQALYQGSDYWLTIW